MSQTQVKISLNGSVRRFSVSQDASWTEFLSHIFSIFALPSEQQVTVTYVDEDGDTVLLSTDQELHDALVNQGIKRFTLQVTDSPQSTGSSAAPLNAQERAASARESVVTVEDDQDVTMTDPEPDTAPEPAQQPQEQTSGSTSGSSLPEQFKLLGDQIRDTFNNNPQLMETLDNIRKTMEEETTRFARVFEQEFARPFQGCSRSGSWTGHRHFGRPPCHPFHGPRHPPHPPHPHHPRHPPHPHPHHHDHQQQQERPTENVQEFDMEERLSWLDEMGFPDRERNTDLLKRYNGNIARVVDILSHERDLAYNNL